jgi:glycerol-3-phosphate dehydrogenase (NAD(P)+)
MIGVIGSGSFGTAIANLIATNKQVLLYSRNAEIVEKINKTRQHLSVEVHDNILAVNSLQEIAERCDLLFPVVPSGSFRSMMKDLSPHLHPYHLLIHGTKGFDVKEPKEGEKIGRQHIRTMSEVIQEESVVVRIGCLSGPNLAKEIMDGQPTATVIASHFK